VYLTPLLKGFPLVIVYRRSGSKDCNRLPGRERSFTIYFSLLDTIHERYGLTDTGQQQRSRLCITSHGNKLYDLLQCCWYLALAHRHVAMWGEGGGIGACAASGRDDIWQQRAAAWVKYTVYQKVCHFYFTDNFGKSGPNYMFFFTVKFTKDLREKLELKLPPSLKSVAALPCVKQVVN